MDYKLSYDMKMEILSRTSLKALHAMRCTNKGFNKLTYDSYLLDMYRKRNNMISGLIIQSISRNPNKYIKEFVPWSPESSRLDLGFIPENAPILASSEQGIIVLLARPYPRKYHVCKLTTKQLVELPHPLTHFKTEMVSIIVVGSNPLHYKILRLSHPQNFGPRWDTAYYCEIFDSMTWAWTLVELLELPKSVYFTGSAITTRRSFFILLSNNDIFKLDPYLKKWTMFSSPISSNNVLLRNPKLSKYQGKLGFVCNSLHGFLEIWILNIDEPWTKMYVLDKEEDAGHMSIEALLDSHTSVMLDDNTLLFKQFREGNIIKKTVKLSDQPSHTFFFQSDFEVRE